MNLPLNPDLIGLLVATSLTLCIFSYLLKGDFFLYRMAVAILTGGGAAYALAIVLLNVVPRVFMRLSNPSDRVGWTFAMIGLILGALVLFKGFQRFGWAVWIGNFPIAYLLGVGAGVAISGAIFGTLLTQGQAAATGQGGVLPGQGLVGSVLNLFNPLIMLAVTLAVLISFTFLANMQRGLGAIYTRLVRAISGFGRGALAVAFGAVFASVYIASVSVLISRIQFIVESGKVIIETISQLASR